MYLSKISISGFKSFLQKTDIELKKDKITLIVGPNGCGKSNIFEAILWVMGENKKNIRIDNSDNVIFAGSENAASVNLAQVHLHFINDKEKDIPKYGKRHEFQVSRKLFRDGNNQYYINQTPCRLLDVKTLLMDLNVSYSGYSFINQNSVTEIIQSKPEEKRQVIEEAAGLMKFKTLKKEAENRLKNTENNLLRIEDRRLELQESSEKLFKQSNLLENYLEVKGRIEFLQKMILAVRWQKATNELKKQLLEKEKIHESSNKIKLISVKNELVILENKILQKEKNLEKILIDCEKISKECRKLDSELQVHHRLFDQNDYWLEKLEQEQSELKEDINKKEKELKNIIAEAPLKFELDKIIMEHLKKVESSCKNLEKTKQEKEQEYKKNHLQLSDTKNFIQWKEQRLKEIISYTDLKNLYKELIANWKRKKEKNKLLHIEKNILSKLEEESLALETEITNLQNSKEELQKNIIAKKNSSQEIQQRIKQKENFIQKQYLDDSSFKNIKGYLGFFTNFVSLKESAPRNLHHLFDLISHTAIFSNKKEFDIILDKLKSSNLSELNLLFLDSIPPQEKTLIENKYFIFSKKLSEKNKEKLFEFLNFCQQKSSQPASEVYLYLSFLFKYKKLEKETQRENLILAQQQIITLQKELEKIDSLNLEQKIKETEKNIAKLQQKIQKNKTNQKTTQEKINAQQKEFWQLEIKLSQQRKSLKEIKKNNQNHLQLQKDITEKQQNLQEFKTTNERLEKEIKAIELEYNKLKLELEKTIKKHTEQEEKQKEYKLKENLHQQNILRLKNEAESLKNNLEKKEKSLADWKNREKEKIKIKDLKKDFEDKTQKRNNYKVELDKEQKDLDSIKEKKNDLINKKIQLENKIDEKIKTNFDIELKIQSIKDNQKNLVEQLQENHEATPEEILRNFYDKNFDIQKSKEELAKLKGKMPYFANVHLGATEEYKEVKKKLDLQNKEKDDLEKSLDSLKKAIYEIEKNSKDIFIRTFKQINESFQKFFPLVFKNGKAFLVLENEKDLLNAKIEIFAQPAGKNLQNLNLLSSGEKSLVGLVFIFSILQIRPNIFCLLDEVDAALDNANINRIINIIKEVAKSNQIIMISHNQKTILIGDIILGITMIDKGISRVFSVDINKQKTELMG